MVDGVDIGWIFNSFGVPGLLVIMLWRAGKWFATFMKDDGIPMAKQLVVKHNEFLDSTSSVLGKVADKQDEHSATLQEHGRHLQEIKDKIK